jgi:L-fuculose-phosphate aldolase
MDIGRGIVAAGARLAAHGLIVGAEGNMSVRLADGHLLITSTGRRKDEMTIDDLVTVSIDRVTVADDERPGEVRPRPSSDLAIHRAIYRERPDVMAVVHAHVPAAMALTLAGEAPDPSVLPETAFHLPRLPVVPFGRMGSEELAVRIARALSDRPIPFPDAVLLERHGAVTVGGTLEQAVDRMDLVDVLCRTWRDARLLAPDRRLEPPRPPGG